MIDALLKRWESNRRLARETESNIEAINMRLPLMAAEPYRAGVGLSVIGIKTVPYAILWFPYDKQSIRAREAEFSSAGWTLRESKMLPEYADYISDWRSPDNQVAVRLWFESNVSGATCKRIEIGSQEITYTKKFYEVACPDAE